jgi:acyl carrier protein
MADPAPVSAAGTGLESDLVRIYSDVLGLPEIGLDDEFFALGGDSLRAARLVTRARADLGVSMTLDLLVRAPTVRGLAEQLRYATVVRPPDGQRR